MLNATTVTSTYGHTLSLHNARPICIASRTEPPTRCRAQPAAANRSPSSTATGATRSSSRTALVWTSVSAGTGDEPIGAPREVFHYEVAGSEGRRSEAPTSELKSLMRKSYAVFCLKKKQINKQ